MGKSLLAIEIGKRIKLLREEKCLQQKDLSDSLNITRSNISKYETGDLEINYDILNNVSNFFDVSLDFIFGISPNPQIKTNEADELYNYIKHLKPAINKGLSPIKFKKLIDFWETMND
jgi:transcriptional regulator with XRE-family HTH domain